MLRITIDNELKFKIHIVDLCKKESYKLYALWRIREYLKVEKARILANVFIDNQFNYASLIWMFVGKTIKSAIFITGHFRWFTMNIEYNNVSIHQRHLQYLALEVFKSLMPINVEIMRSYFNENPILHDLRKGTKVLIPPVKSFRLGLNFANFRGSILWNNLPSLI